MAGLWRVLLGFMLTGSLLAETYHVAPDGKDGDPGSKGWPMRTIGAALQRAKAGDRVVVREGEYNERLILPRSGITSKPITLAAEGKVVIRPPETQGVRHGLVGKEIGHWVIEGFEIVDAQQGIKFKNGHDLVVRRCVVRGSETGFSLEGEKAENLLIEEVECSGNRQGGFDVARGVAMNNVTFRGCKSHHNECDLGTDGFGISHSCKTEDVVFEKCEAYENGSDGFDIGGQGGVVLQDCESHHNGTRIWGGNFKCWNPGSKLVRCTGWVTGKKSDANFEISGEDVELLNCTSGENADSGIAVSGPDVLVTGCIIAFAKKQAIKLKTDKNPKASIIARDNLLFQCGEPGAIRLGQDGNHEGDPRFINPQNHDYRTGIEP
jgi:hypothetical protein